MLEELILAVVRIGSCHWIWFNKQRIIYKKYKEAKILKVLHPIPTQRCSVMASWLVVVLIYGFKTIYTQCRSEYAHTTGVCSPTDKLASPWNNFWRMQMELSPFRRRGSWHGLSHYQRLTLALEWTAHCTEPWRVDTKWFACVSVKWYTRASYHKLSWRGKWEKQWARQVGRFWFDGECWRRRAYRMVTQNSYRMERSDTANYVHVSFSLA